MKKKTKKFPILNGVDGEIQLAKRLSISPVDMSWAIRNAQSMYVKIPLEKKDGSPRTISAPQEKLKLIQRAILDSILANSPLPACVYGFGAGKGIIENAKVHAKNEYLLNLDIQDFFPSVHRSLVEKLFHTLGATSHIATALTKLTTYEHELPQGAPSSPYIAALVLEELDRRLTILCSRNHLSYTRYFDDISISGGSRAHHVCDRVIEIIAVCGFKAHTRPDKLKMYLPGETRLITGIEIKGGELGVSNADELMKYVEELNSDGMKMLRDEDPAKERLSLQGKIVFITQVNSQLGQRLEAEFKKIVW